MLLTLLVLQCVVTGTSAVNGSNASPESLVSPNVDEYDVMNGSDASPIRSHASVPKAHERQLMSLPRLKAMSGPVFRHRIQVALMLVAVLAVASILGLMWQPGAAQGGTARLPPRWEPGSNTSFRAWTQDLMLWSISSDAEPHQQCALVISQLGGAAREVARTMSPQEVMNGGFVNGQQLDPVSYLIHGLSTRFGPLDDEVRLRSAQDLLSFSRRNGETTDTVLSRFDIVRQRARADGGGATVSTETAALILLRAVGVNHTQFQQITQPFGYRLPATEQEFLHMTNAIRRLGHIVESHRDNIASTLRGNQQGANHYWAGSAPSDEATPGYNDGQQQDAGGAGGGGDSWAYHAGDGETDTDSATSSDNNSLMDSADLNGMTTGQVDEYLFGKYQHAKKRWRRFTGKPVRALRRVLRRKGKGKGSKGGLGYAYVNINETLQQSAFYKGKGKGGNSSGKGFGRRLNPKGRDGEVLKCSICQSQFHLRARCPQRNDGSQPAGAPASSVGQIHHTSQASRSMYVHFAAFQAQAGSEQSWSRVDTPREEGDEQGGRRREQEGVPTPQDGNATAEERPEVYQMTPDPLQENDPWQAWMNTDQAQGSGGPGHSTYVPMPSQSGVTVPAWHVPDVRSFLEVSGLATTRHWRWQRTTAAAAVAAELCHDNSGIAVDR